jgi:hypothetical protein
VLRVRGFDSGGVETDLRLKKVFVNGF